MAGASVFALFALLPFAFISATLAADPDMLQDFCVADLNSAVKVNGFPCKDPAKVNVTDFFFSGLRNSGPINNTFGFFANPANVQNLPGLNTLGLSIAHVDYAPGGVVPPHTHPLATEIVYVLEGQLDSGFVTTSNQLFFMTISKGDVFVFPKGLVHFQINNGPLPASAIVAFNSQLLGTQIIPSSLFAANPSVPDSVLTKAFQVGTKEVQKIKAGLAPKK